MYIKSLKQIEKKKVEKLDAKAQKKIKGGNDDIVVEDILIG